MSQSQLFNGQRTMPIFERGAIEQLRDQVKQFEADHANRAVTLGRLHTEVSELRGMLEMLGRRLDQEGRTRAPEKETDDEPAVE